MRDIFVIIYEFGTGGRTVAILDQCRMFGELGLAPSIVTFNYDPRFDARIAERRANGDIPDGTRVINMYRELSAAMTDDPQADWSHEEDTDTTGVSIGLEYTGEFTIEHAFDARGRLVRSRKTRNGTAVETVFCVDGVRAARRDYDERGVCSREVTFDRAWGAAIEERYMTPDGFCYVTRLLHADTGRQRGVFTHDRRTGTSTRYAHNTPWHAAWLQSLIDGSVTRPIAIAESPSAMKKLLGCRGADRLLMVHDNHFKAPHTYGSELRDDYAPVFAELADVPLLVVPTQAQADQIRRQFGGSARVVAVPNVLRDKRSGSVVQKVPGRIGVFSRLAKEQKRIDEMIRIFAEVHAARPGAHLDIYGNGPERDALEALTGRLGLDDAVTFHGRIDGVGDAMASCAVTVSTASNEAFGLSIGESMLAETPVVSYAVDFGPRDLIRDGVDGVLIDNRDAAGFRDALIGLLDDPQRAQRMGSAGAARIAHEFSVEGTRSTWAAAFESAARHELELGSAHGASARAR